MPTITEIKDIKPHVEMELGNHLDTELELGIEFIEELIPYSIEYFTGVKHNPEEIIDYMVC